MIDGLSISIRKWVFKTESEIFLLKIAFKQNSEIEEFKNDLSSAIQWPLFKNTKFDTRNKATLASPHSMRLVHTAHSLTTEEKL